MSDEAKKLERMKQSVVSDLKNLSLARKDRNLLLSLIELFDWLSPDENERFLARLEKLALDKNIQEDEEFQIRMFSLQEQLDRCKNTKIIHFSTFSMYFQLEKIEIYVKKLPDSWDSLIKEIEKCEFDNILIYVYKSVSKKEKILSTKIKKSDNWQKTLLEILDTNIHTNLKITLFYEKQKI